jgi:hypothetical protein
VYLWRFLKLFDINLAKKTNFYEVVVQRATEKRLEHKAHKGWKYKGTKSEAGVVSKAVPAYLYLFVGFILFLDHQGIPVSPLC